MNAVKVKCPPVIILLDIMLVLLFSYIVLPHAKAELNVEPVYKNSLINGIIVINDGVRYVIKDNKLEKSNANYNHYSGWYCEKDKDCYRVFKGYFNAANIEMNDRFKFFVPNESKNKLYAFFERYCLSKNSSFKCNGKFYLDLSSGNVIACDKKMNAYTHDVKKSELIELDFNCD